MKLLLDEMLSHVIATRLRDRGHDIEVVDGQSTYEALSDPDVLDWRARSAAHS